MLWLIGCATAPAISSVPELTYSQQAYVIGIADQLRIDVWRNALYINILYATLALRAVEVRESPHAAAASKISRKETPILGCQVSFKGTCRWSISFVNLS